MLNSREIEEIRRINQPLDFFAVNISTMKKLNSRKTSGLKRDINLMPRNVRSLLVKKGLLELYKARPAYQQNDYLGWISSAKLEVTKQKRLNQMLDELRAGDRYMKMAWKGSK